MAKYKVGDKVRVVSEWPKDCGFTKVMCQYLGKTMTVCAVNDSPAGANYKLCEAYVKCLRGEYYWIFSEDWIAGLAQPAVKDDSDLSVVIRFHGKRTVAQLMRGGTIVKTAVASHNPADKYSRQKGAMVAVERLFCKKSDDKPKESSEPKIGGKFVVIGNEHTPHHCFKKGEIITIAAYHVKKSYIFENECGKRQHVNELDVKPYKGESK